MREWRAANREKVVDINRRYREANREKVAEAKRRWARENPEKAAAMKAAWRIANKEKVAADLRRWHETNPDKVHAARAQYKAAHPEKRAEQRWARRARLQGALVNDFTQSQWEWLKAVYRRCCAYCGTATAQLTKDHIIPLARGGSHSINNIIPACHHCNEVKHVSAPPPFQMAMTGLYS